MCQHYNTQYYIKTCWPVVQVLNTVYRYLVLQYFAVKILDSYLVPVCNRFEGLEVVRGAAMTNGEAVYFIEMKLLIKGRRTRICSQDSRPK